MSCMGQNSGVSRNLPVRSAFADRKFPHRAWPKANVASPPTVPKEPYFAARLPEGFCPSPDRVTAFTTRLVLSPNSAGGEPDTTSMDWIAFAGIEVEKTLLRWSEMG